VPGLKKLPARPGIGDEKHPLCAAEGLELLEGPLRLSAAHASGLGTHVVSRGHWPAQHGLPSAGKPPRSALRAPGPDACSERHQGLLPIEGPTGMQGHLGQARCAGSVYGTTRAGKVHVCPAQSSPGCSRCFFTCHSHQARMAILVWLAGSAASLVRVLEIGPLSDVSCGMVRARARASMQHHHAHGTIRMMIY
jgi:hypothetical protein